MPIIFGTVNAPSSTSAADGANTSVLQGKQGDMLVSEVHGKFYTQNYRNNVYYAANAAAGGTVSVFSATAYTGLGIWNLSTTKNIVPIRATAAISTAAGTGTTIGYMYVPNAGFATGTAAPISATTAVTATRGPAVLGPLATGQGASVALAVSAATFTAAPSLFIPTGVSAGTAAITAPNTFLGLSEYFDGSLIIAPGTFFGIALAVTSTNTTNVSLLWEEVPL